MIANALGSGNVLRLVFQSLYQGFAQMVGIVGLTPPEFAGIVVTILLVAMAVQFYGFVTNRNKWSLERPDDASAILHSTKE